MNKDKKTRTRAKTEINKGVTQAIMNMPELNDFVVCLN